MAELQIINKGEYFAQFIYGIKVKNKPSKGWDENYGI